MASGSRIRDWSTNPANNELTVPFGAPINWYPSEVSPWSRQSMASVRTQCENAEWFNWGHIATQTSATTFTIPTNLTAIYHVGRRLRITDTTVLLGTITAVSFSSPNTTVTVSLDSGSLTSTMNGQNVEVGIISAINPSFPIVSLSPLFYAVSAGTNTYTATMTNPKITAYENGRIYNIAITASNTTVSTININSLGARSIVLSGGGAIPTASLTAGMTALLFYDLANTRFILINPSKQSFYVTAFLSTPFGINAGQTLEIPFNGIVEDTSGFYNPATGRLTPNFPCRVFATSNVNFQFGASITSDGVQVSLAKNGSPFIGSDITNQGGASRTSIRSTGYVSLNGAGDFLSITGFNNTNQNSTVQTGLLLTNLNIYLI